MKIDKNIPIPPITRGVTAGMTTTLRSMKAGESFVAPLKTRNSIQSCARSARIKVAVRKISPTECRVWVVSKEVTP
jgi:hypothetical protein